MNSLFSRMRQWRKCPGCHQEYRVTNRWTRCWSCRNRSRYRPKKKR